MEKKREQDLSVLEALRLHREFHLPRSVPADEQEKPLNVVAFFNLKTSRDWQRISPRIVLTSNRNVFGPFM